MSNERGDAKLGPCEACQPGAKDGMVRLPNCRRCDGTGRERIVQMQAAEQSMFALTSNGRVLQHQPAYSRMQWIEVRLP